MTPQRPFAYVLPALAVVLLLSACSPPAPETAPSAAAGVTEGAEEFDPATCLIGEWTITEEQMQVFYDKVSEGVDGITFDVQGDTGLTFRESDYSYLPDFTLGMTVAGTPASGTIAGSINGDYTVDGGLITTSHDSTAVTMTVEVAGTTMDGAELFGQMLAASPVNSAPYECQSGPTLVIQMDTGYGRAPIELIRRA
ncbi:MAG: hypothetical protein KF761_08875 [Salinibacterium sp.]|nr:hypothetical protein [Salinibacterium sp.]